MTLPAFYSENDSYAAQWLRNLVEAGHVAPGAVDSRSIVDVRPSDLDDFGQVHLFAGIGIWSAAFRKAGIPDNFPAFSASCPCQPFSSAGRKAGFSDERHLWPVAHRLIAERRPKLIFGEQVASADGLAWLDHVLSDLQGEGYSAGAVDSCAAGYGAPHIRQRLYWAAFDLDGDFELLERAVRPLDDSEGIGRRILYAENDGSSDVSLDASTDTGLGSAFRRGQKPSWMPDSGQPGPVNGPWADADWLFCRDRKWRPVEPGTFPLADVNPGRVGRLRAYGNALVLEQAAEFVRDIIEYLTQNELGQFVSDHRRFSGAPKAIEDLRSAPLSAAASEQPRMSADFCNKVTGGPGEVGDVDDFGEMASEFSRTDPLDDGKHLDPEWHGPVADGEDISDPASPGRAESERDRPLDFHWSVDKKAVARAGFRATGDTAYDRAFRAMAAALVLAYRANGGWVSYSRRRGWYSDKSRYQGIPYTYANVTNAVDELVKLGLAEEDRALPGDHLRTGRQSRLRATPKLAQAFEGVRFTYDPCELIRLRDADGNLVGYSDTDRIWRKRREMQAINKALSSVRLSLPSECIPRGDEHVEVGGGIVRMTPSPVLYRVFCRGRWDKNGRAYWWGQNLPSACRAAMLIDGEDVVEIDYAALHPRMLYAKQGVKLDFDPYSVPGFPRQYGKRALLIGINAASPRSAIKALMDRRDKGGKRWPFDYEATRRLFDAVVERNEAIADKIASDAGIDLMNDDAEVAIRVVKRCLGVGIACLPIHDSFVVQARHAAVLRSIMDDEMMRYEARARDKVGVCNKNRKVVSSPTDGMKVLEGVTGEVGMSGLKPSVPGGDQVTSDNRRSAFDFDEQQRRLLAYRRDPSKEYIPVPGESESILWAVFGERAVEFLKRSNEQQARHRCFGVFSGIEPIPTLAERRAGRRLPVDKGGTLPRNVQSQTSA